MGVKVTDIYWTLGDHDGVLIFEAPDDETATTLLLHLAALGLKQANPPRPVGGFRWKREYVVSLFPSAGVGMSS